MKILVACEYSGRVREAFRRRGHDVVSCDLMPTELPGPHYQGNVLDILGNGWDMLVGFPPCTYLSNVNSWRKTDITREREQACAFFLKLWTVNIAHIALENPPGWLNNHILRPTQTVRAYQFGESYVKPTCLWLKNLPPLTPTCVVTPTKHNYIRNMPGGKNQSKRRSLTPWGLAEAMAAQWG